MRNTFKVYERLKKEQHIDTLFRSGKAFSVFPVRVVYQLAARPADEPSPARAGFSVPKKKFKSSVKRHRIRRLLVEAWRLNKHLLYPAIPEGKQLQLFLIFTDGTLPKYETVLQSVLKGVDKLAGILAPVTGTVADGPRYPNSQFPIPNSEPDPQFPIPNSEK